MCSCNIERVHIGPIANYMVQVALNNRVAASEWREGHLVQLGDDLWVKRAAF